MPGRHLLPCIRVVPQHNFKVTTTSQKKSGLLKSEKQPDPFDPFAKCIGDGDKMLLSKITIR